jgi:GNAT superfamily N-acetyltransferase
MGRCCAKDGARRRHAPRRPADRRRTAPRQSRWVDVPEGRIYLRRARHPGIGETIDIPNIAFDEEARGKGAFTRYLREIEIEAQRAGLDGVYVENIFNPRLARFLRGRGYEEEVTLWSGPPCLFKRFSNLDRGDEYPDFDRHEPQRGRHIFGVAHVDGGIAWSFDRKRGLEI